MIYLLAMVNFHSYVKLPESMKQVGFWPAKMGDFETFFRFWIEIFHEEKIQILPWNMFKIRRMYLLNMGTMGQWVSILYINWLGDFDYVFPFSHSDENQHPHPSLKAHTVISVKDIRNHHSVHGTTHFLVVVWKVFYFSITYGIILPIDFHIFQDG